MSPPKSIGRNTKNAFEWIVFGLSCLLVAAAVGVLVFHAVQQKEAPAELRAESGEIIRRDDLTIIPIKLTNRGSKTAAEVRIDVDADFPSGRKSAELSFDFVPPGGTREGFVVFAEKDAPVTIIPRVAGYIEP